MQQVWAATCGHDGVRRPCCHYDCIYYDRDFSDLLFMKPGIVFGRCYVYIQVKDLGVVSPVITT